MVKPVHIVVYKPDSQSTNEYITIVNAEEYKKWLDDKTIPLVEVVGTYEIYHSGQGSQGVLGRVSKQELDTAFGTDKVDVALPILLQRGVLQQSDKFAKQFGDTNLARGTGYTTSTGASYPGNMEIDASDPQVTLTFYKRLYPFKQIATWLSQSHNPTHSFTHREWSFTLVGDIYLRYHSFYNAEELKNAVIRLNPTRFEIGAVYSGRPRDKKTIPAAAFKPVQRELVFDIDMTDYDAIRTCCSGKGICKRCWAFISAAVQVLDPALREEFGFKHLLWVYSGRRGIHCWVSDTAALALTDEERKAIMSYLEAIKGGDKMAKKVNVRATIAGKPGRLHPVLSGAYEILSQEFTDIILEDQKCFDERPGWEALLELIPDKAIVASLREKWEGEPNRSSKKKWADAVSYIKSDESTLRPAFEDIVLQYTYPRLDAEVSKHRNHLLKAPFCIHPATGNICVPIDPGKVAEFDPHGVPTIAKLLEELGALKDVDSERPEWEQTSLKPYVQMLVDHSDAIMSDLLQKRKAANAKAMDF